VRNITNERLGENIFWVRKKLHVRILLSAKFCTENKTKVDSSPCGGGGDQFQSSCIAFAIQQ